ncbi:MAG TPA: hypothetical protein VEQ11_13160 [Chloroflexota bacterium]|nr:hypothetical protein [Chloroflexota bacterium]
MGGGVGPGVGEAAGPTWLDVSPLGVLDPTGAELAPWTSEAPGENTLSANVAPSAWTSWRREMRSEMAYSVCGHEVPEPLCGNRDVPNSAADQI